RTPAHPGHAGVRRRPLRGGLPRLPAGVGPASPATTRSGALDPARRPHPRAVEQAGGPLMLDELLPAGVVAVETVGPDDPAASLLPEDRPMVAKAVAKRSREVTNARTCARRALAALGRPEAPIL